MYGRYVTLSDDTKRFLGMCFALVCAVIVYGIDKDSVIWDNYVEYRGWLDG